jgi:hypothetical protein
MLAGVDVVGWDETRAVLIVLTTMLSMGIGMMLARVL